MNYCIKCIVKGRVQGVFFRDSTRARAHELKLTGHAYNLLNGDVEVVACGDEDNVLQLQQWLLDGPAHATVTDVTCEEIDCDVEGGFIIG